MRAHVAREFARAGRALSLEPERPEDAFDARRGQHSSTPHPRVAARTGTRAPQRVLGLTDVDLFIPILTFVFGEAQLGGRAAVVSTARLGDTPLVPGEAARSRCASRRKPCTSSGTRSASCTARDPRCAMARSPSLQTTSTRRPPPSAATAAPATSRTLGETETSMSKKNTRILIVDDEEIVRESLSGWLGKDGYTIGTAPDGPTALEARWRRTPGRSSSWT